MVSAALHSAKNQVVNNDDQQSILVKPFHGSSDD